MITTFKKFIILISCELAKFFQDENKQLFKADIAEDHGEVNKHN
jgi:hypothetical protein